MRRARLADRRPAPGDLAKRALRDQGGALGARAQPLEADARVADPHAIGRRILLVHRRSRKRRTEARQAPCLAGARLAAGLTVARGGGSVMTRTSRCSTTSSEGGRAVRASGADGIAARGAAARATVAARCGAVVRGVEAGAAGETTGSRVCGARSAGKDALAWCRGAGAI